MLSQNFSMHVAALIFTIFSAVACMEQKSCEAPVKTPVYEARDGLLFVQPYVQTLEAACKQRWIGRTLLEVYCAEFATGHVTPAYIAEAIARGAIGVDGACADPLTKLRASSRVSHCVHVHEPATPDDPIAVCYEDAEVLAVRKPSSLPVHATGRYRFASLVERLRVERGDTKSFLAPCNRLDVATSGLVLIAKTPAAAAHTKSASICSICSTPFTTIRCTLPKFGATQKPRCPGHRRTPSQKQWPHCCAKACTASSFRRPPRHLSRFTASTENWRCVPNAPKSLQARRQ